VEALRRAGARLRGDLVLACVVGEIESSPVDRHQGARNRGHGQGTRHLLAHGGLADACILGEPSNLGIGIGNCGTVWARITAHGPVMGSYASTWENNAIYRANRVIAALTAWQADYVARHRRPDLEPGVTICATEGGWPWRAARTRRECSLYVDVRTMPDQPLISVRDELAALVRSVQAEDPAFPIDVDCYASAPGFEMRATCPSCRRSSARISPSAGSPRRTAAPGPPTMARTSRATASRPWCMGPAGLGARTARDP
jgi:acetylornithine deacetylase